MDSILVVCYSYTGMGNRGAANAVAEIGALLGHAPLAATAFTAREVDDGSCAPRVQALGRALQQASPGAGTIAASTWLPRLA